MKYEVEVTADELMLTAEELKEIFECYFDDAIELIASCYIAYGQGDFLTLGKKIHALKGSSMNLRMDEMAALVIELEILTKKEEGAEILQYLLQIENELEILKIGIQKFYHDAGEGY